MKGTAMKTGIMKKDISAIGIAGMGLKKGMRVTLDPLERLPNLYHAAPADGMWPDGVLRDQVCAVVVNACDVTLDLKPYIKETYHNGEVLLIRTAKNKWVAVYQNIPAWPKKYCVPHTCTGTSYRNSDDPLDLAKHAYKQYATVGGLRRSLRLSASQRDKRIIVS
jgi:hypothetical protein